MARSKWLKSDIQGAASGNSALSSSGLAARGGDALPFRLEDFTGIATWAGKPIFNQQQVIGQIDAGVVFKGKTITFTFLDQNPVGLYNNPNYGFSEPGGYSPMSDA